MITQAIIFINSMLFLLISAIHFYWGFGGKWGAKYAIPSKETSTEPLFKPRFFETLVVALGFLFFVLILLNVGELIHIDLVSDFQKHLLWFLVVVFFIRAIGEFRYVGLFKKIKSTPFAINDTKYYTPLCLWLAFSVAYLAYMTHYR